MANEAVLKLGTQKTLEANGGSIANNAVVQADDATYSLSIDASMYPDAEFVLSNVVFPVAPIEGSVLALYARPLDVDSTADTEVPEAGRPTLPIGSFIVNNVTTAQAMVLLASNLPLKADYYIHNVGTGQSVSAGWVLKVTPRTIGPA